MSEQVAMERMKEMTLYAAIEQNGMVIGTIGWQKASEGEGHIRGIAVIHNRQGKTSPTATLLKTVNDDARSKESNILTLDSTKY
ncbi:MAG: hypothetical protein HWN81_19010 [Candidatus Lokiarchaeota archaeon]|nr:hypothetical protein [Candidatus Lokiarchaeota archaeon]